MMKQYVYLLSCEHSGSTLLSFVLGAHPLISTVGEIAGYTHYSNYKCSCGFTFYECPFWQQVLKEMSREGFSFDLSDFGINISPYLYGKPYFYRLYHHVFYNQQLEFLKNRFFEIFFPSFYRDLILRVKKNFILANVISQIQKKPIFFDSTKDHFRLKLLKQISSVPVKVIHLVRDGKAVVGSMIKREGYSPHKAINTWIKKNETIERLKKNYFSESDWFFLRYEDLCNNTSLILSDLSNFLGVDSSFNLSSFDKSKFHVIGNTMRLSFDGTIRKPSVPSLETEVENLFVLNKRAMSLYRKYGYV